MTSTATRAREERGASAVEYGLLITGIAVVIAASVFLFGAELSNLFGHSCDSLTSHGTGTATCAK